MMRQSRVFRWPSTSFLGVAPRSIERLDRAARLALSIAVVTVACLAIAFATGLLALPTASPAGPAVSSPVAQVLFYATTWRGPAADPVITLPNGLPVKSSNYRGVPIGNVVYYYNLAPSPSYDPLGRGQVTADQIDVVAVVGDPPQRVLVYTLK
jgi:hypothetical protein